MKLSKQDVRRALTRHQFGLSATPEEAFGRLRSVQFDPISPAGGNHDLVLQSRVPGYRVGDWEKLAYEDRFIYDGWDKQASLVPFSGWPLRRLFHSVYRESLRKVLEQHPDAAERVLKDLEARGPLMPKEFEFQARVDAWEGSWYGPNLVKQTLRALWHSGQVMTSGRRNGQHVYDLAERIVPRELREEPLLCEEEARNELVLERHRAMGLIRPAAPYEVWSYGVLAPTKKVSIAALVDRGDLVPVDVEGMAANATPEFLTQLDEPSIDRRIVFVAPLDPLLWDRKMVSHLFDFDYVWEIYTPEAKRRWGYYVLPILFGDELVARVEFNCRAGKLEVRQWHLETPNPGSDFYDALSVATRKFADYCSATSIEAAEHIGEPVRCLLQRAL